MREVATPADPDPLSEREVEVLKLLARGATNKEIALDLSIQETTVKSHVSSILGKLAVPSRTHAALYAARAGLAELASTP